MTDKILVKKDTIEFLRRHIDFVIGADGEDRNLLSVVYTTLGDLLSAPQQQERHYPLPDRLYKADPVDVANFSMMLHQNGQCIELPPEARREPAPADAALVEALEKIAAERMMCDSASDAKTKVVSLGLCINRIQTTAKAALAVRGKCSNA